MTPVTTAMEVVSDQLPMDLVGRSYLDVEAKRRDQRAKASPTVLGFRVESTWYLDNSALENKSNDRSHFESLQKLD